MENLIVLNNEKVSKHNGKFFSRNYNFKILTEGLNMYFKVEYIVRKSEVNESHELNLDKIKIASNIIQFIFYVLSTFKNKKSKYYLICITPYTFIASLFLFIFRKKVYVYLISSCLLYTSPSPRDSLSSRRQRQMCIRDRYYTLYFYCVFIFVHFQKKSLCVLN